MAEHGEDLLELSLDTFLTVTREDQFPLELATHLSLEQCQQLIPQVCQEKQSHHFQLVFILVYLMFVLHDIQSFEGTRWLEKSQCNSNVSPQVIIDRCRV